MASGWGGFPDFGADAIELSGHARQHRLCSGKEPSASPYRGLASRSEAPTGGGFFSNTSNRGFTIHVASSRVNSSICRAQERAQVCGGSRERSALRQNALRLLLLIGRHLSCRMGRTRSMRVLFFR